MSDIQSNRDQFEALATNTDQKPFAMLNLLKFESKDGREKYFQYIKASGPFVKDVGGEVIYFGKAGELLCGSESWDIVMLVRYPSRKAFLKMADNPEYQEVHKLCKEALERAVLCATDPVTCKEII